MKNLPMFTTKNGIASLTLQEIPYTKRAYIRLQGTWNVEALLKECIEFCRAVGAETVFATGDAMLCKYPIHTQILSMIAERSKLKNTNASAVPVTENDIGKFRDIYNKKISDVSNAAYMTQADADALLIRGGGYFIWEKDTMIGIGIINGGNLDMVASVLPGMGMTVLSALSTLMPKSQISLQVASDNTKAIELYKRAGFVKKEIISTWYKVF